MNIRKSILIFFLFFINACFGGSTTVSTTSQILSNQGLQFLAELVQQFQQALNGATNCVEFNQALSDLVSTQNCAMGGTQSQEILESACEDSPDFAGEATLSLTFQDCREPGQTVGGILLFELDWDGSLLATQIKTNDYSFNGTPYVIQDLSINVDAAGVPECSGFLLTFGEICGVTSDCNFCPF